MARTLRGARHDKRDGYQSHRGLDRCPPAPFRRSHATKPLRAELRATERLALRVLDPEEMPVVVRVRMPWFT